MKHLKKFNEEINQDLKGKKCKSCNKGTYQETSLMDDLSGTLHCNKCGESVNRYVNDFPTKPGFVEKRQRMQEEYESKYKISLTIPHDAYLLLRENGVPESNIVAVYTEYVNQSLGLYTHTAGLDEFSAWCENPDNLVDFQEEE